MKLDIHSAMSMSVWVMDTFPRMNDGAGSRRKRERERVRDWERNFIWMM